MGGWEAARTRACGVPVVGHNLRQSLQQARRLTRVKTSEFDSQICGVIGIGRQPAQPVTYLPSKRNIFEKIISENIGNP